MLQNWTLAHDTLALSCDYVPAKARHRSARQTLLCLLTHTIFVYPARGPTRIRSRGEGTQHLLGAFPSARALKGS